MRRLIFASVTHGAALSIGFALGIYLLPILTAPPSPDASMLEEMAQDAVYQGPFTRELLGSDLLRWGEGTISLTTTQMVHEGALAPGPDYMAYLVPQFVSNEAEYPAAEGVVASHRIRQNLRRIHSGYPRRRSA